MWYKLEHARHPNRIWIVEIDRFISNTSIKISQGAVFNINEGWSLHINRLLNFDHGWTMQPVTKLDLDIIQKLKLEIL